MALAATMSALLNSQTRRLKRSVVAALKVQAAKAPAVVPSVHLGASVRYTRYDKAPGPPDPLYRSMLNHASYDLIYRDPRLWEWAFAKRTLQGEEAGRHPGKQLMPVGSSGRTRLPATHAPPPGARSGGGARGAAGLGSRRPSAQARGGASDPKEEEEGEECAEAAAMSAAMATPWLTTSTVSSSL